NYHTIIKHYPQRSQSNLRQISSGNFEIIVKKDKEEIKREEKIEKRKTQALVFLGLCLILSALIIFLALAPINISRIKSIMLMIFVLLLILITILGIKIIKS